MSEAATWYDRLDAPSRATLQRARDEAERANHGYLGTEHLFLALLAHPRTPTRRVLRSFGLDLDSVRAAFNQLRPTVAEHTQAVQRGTSTVDLTPEAKRAIELALARARAANQASVGTEQLLLGLLDLDSGAAVDLLRVRGVDLNALRATGGTNVRAPSARHPATRPDVDLHQPELVLSNLARNNVVMCRLDDPTLEALDTLIEAGVRANRSDAAAWLISIGLSSKAAVVEAVKDKVAEIRRIRDSARALAEDAGASTS